MAAVRKAKVEEVNTFINDAKNVIGTPISDEVAKSYMEYSLSVVFSRALVSATDGLKPVGRRILFSMYRDGFTPDKNYVKSARTVGNVMAALHPHGDMGIYNAMVKLAQPFYTNVKYIDGYGNWGDAGGSGAAAARYTESRLDKSAILLLSELRENAVDMKPNYDGEEEEPTVLPVQFPTLVINGTFGLAVGFSANMAPHNPSEVLDATRWLLTHPNADLDKLMTFIPGPDFPTGGQIIGMDAIREAYETGKGIIKIRSTYHVETGARGKHTIVFTEMPYGVKTEAIITKIKDGIKNQKLQGIADVKDLTDRKNGIRLTVETKTGVNPEALVLDLFKNTPLEDSFGINNVALVKENHNGKMMDVPKTLGLKEQLEIFLAHRIDVVTRRTQFRKDKRTARLHILEGMMKALANIDEVIRIIRAAADANIAQTQLIKKFKLDETQADYILSIPLRRLTKFDQIELNEEKIKLLGEVKELDKILMSDDELRKVIADELTAVRRQLDRPRRSVLVNGTIADHLQETKKLAASVSVEVADEPTTVWLTADGNIVQSAKKPSGSVIGEAVTTTRGKFVLVTNKARAFRVDTLHVPAKGAPVSTIVPESLAQGEKVLTVFPIALEQGKTGGLAMGTKNGVVKIQGVNWPVKTDDFSVISLADGDEIVNARWVPDSDTADLVFITSDSSLLTFPAKLVRPQGALTSGGMAGVKLASEQHVLGFDVIYADEKEQALVVTVSDAGNGKATPFHLYPAKGRATGGVRSLKLLATDKSVAYGSVDVSPALKDSDGNSVALPATDPRRDGSGKPMGSVPVR